jgi:hypothetical protein
MKVVTSLILVILMLLSVGCVSCPEKGRITLINWDSRDAEQLQAAQASDNIIWSERDMEEKPTPRVFEWAALFAMISQLKVRIQIVNIEWDK